ncbi:MAG: hypothetical protein HQL24_08600 [Candidatus Omnitrophica bacterium]|nr:hypothetical protein [Candidatus Omnitrophota bacterium]
MEIGLKIWASNKGYAKEVSNLIDQCFCDFIEIYVDEGCKEEDAEFWRNIIKKVSLHAPHSYGGFNPANPGFLEEKTTALRKIEVFRRELNPLYIIFHPGIEGQLTETIRQYKKFKQEFPAIFDLAYIENKPKIGCNDEICLGASMAEVNEIQECLGFGFCLDIAHVMCYAAWARQSWEPILDDFLLLKPNVFHLCDGFISSEKDSHLHLGEGDYDFKNVLEKMPRDGRVVIEAQHDSTERLDDFRKDVVFLRKCLS